MNVIMLKVKTIFRVSMISQKKKLQQFRGIIGLLQIRAGKEFSLTPQESILVSSINYIAIKVFAQQVVS